MPTGTVLRLTDIDFIRDGRTILSRINWEVRSNERWVVLGPNGSGKTTLCRMSSLYLHPSRGTIDVLGQRLGKTDVRELRTHLGFTSPALAAMLRPDLRVEDVVVTGKNAALAPYWHSYTEDERNRARQLLERFGCEDLGDAEFGTLSSGERQRVMLTRTLMNDPSLLLLDEPTTRLDLGGREVLIALLARLAADDAAPATIMVTHHVDEIPPGFTHALLLRKGQVLAKGPIETTLTARHLSRCFDLSLQVTRRAGRWSAWRS